MNLSPRPQGGTGSNEPGAGEHRRFSSGSQASGDAPYRDDRSRSHTSLAAGASGRQSEDHPPSPPPRKLSQSHGSNAENARITKLERDLQESEMKAKLWREQVDDTRRQLVDSMTESSILKRDLEQTRERLRGLEAQASQPSRRASHSFSSLNDGLTPTRADYRVVEALRARERELLDEVKELHNELDSVKQELWEAEQSHEQARLLKLELDSTRERLRQLEANQGGLGNRPWSAEGAIYEVRRSTMDTSMSLRTRVHQVDGQDPDLRSSNMDSMRSQPMVNGNQSPNTDERAGSSISQTFVIPADRSSVKDVIQKVNAVNEEIFQIAAYLGEVLFYEVTAPGGVMQGFRQRAIDEGYEGAKNILGEKLATALAQASMKESKEEINPLLVHIVMQVALTNWCGMLGRRWTTYQKVEPQPVAGSMMDQQRESSSSSGTALHADYEKFVSVLYDRIRTHEDQGVAGRWRSVTRAHIPFSTNEWDRYLMAAISAVMGVSGWVTSPDVDTNQIQRRLTSLFKPLFDLRKAIGEEITAIDLDIAVIRPGEAFDQSYMEDAYSVERLPSKPKRRNSASDVVAGSTGLGLQRRTVRRSSIGGVQRQAEMFLSMPKVVLEKTIKEALEGPPRVRKKMDNRGSTGGRRGSAFGVMFGL